MTRINCVNPMELSNPHLIVEMKEITRVYTLSWKAYRSGKDPSQFPREYTLGTGHVMFFYARLGYIDKRHKALCEEMTRRGYVIPLRKHWPWHEEEKRNDTYGVTLADWPDSWKQNWAPTAKAIALNRQRLKERMAVINSWN